MSWREAGPWKNEAATLENVLLEWLLLLLLLVRPPWKQKSQLLSLLWMRIFSGKKEVAHHNNIHKHWVRWRPKPRKILPRSPLNGWPPCVQTFHSNDGWWWWWFRLSKTNQKWGILSSSLQLKKTGIPGPMLRNESKELGVPFWSTHQHHYYIFSLKRGNKHGRKEPNQMPEETGGEKWESAEDHPECWFVSADHQHYANLRAIVNQ